MSGLSDIILPTGLVLLGAYALSKLLAGRQPTCSGATSQTCIGPMCWSTCQATGGSSGTQNAGQQGTDLYGTPYASYPVGSMNLGLPAGPGNTPGTCGPLDWITNWQGCGFSW